jgi:maleylacetate reductase
MESFIYEGLPYRVIFGADFKSQVVEELARMGHTRALVLSTPGQEREAAELHGHLGDSSVGTYTGATMHTPRHVTDDAMALVDRLEADCVVALGGGSAIGLGKAIAARSGLDQIVLPTTYAGSEVTPIIGETVDSVKTTRRSVDVLPEVVIYDVALTLTLPVPLSVTSAFNSMAHAVEAMWAKDRNPIVTLMAGQAIGSFIESLPEIVADPTGRKARGTAQYAAWLAGTCLASVGMALHHKLCHVIGGTFDLPHAETHTIVLPYAVAYNGGCAPQVVAELERGLGAPAAVALQKFQRTLGAPSSLAELGMPEEGIATVVDRCIQSPYWNPRSVDAHTLTALVYDAWMGAEPDASRYAT